MLQWKAIMSWAMGNEIKTDGTVPSEELVTPHPNWDFTAWQYFLPI
ncbi:hypothetical protein JNM05_00390 [bacterium]|nr:hypothetical protein [bacterium]